MKGSLATALAIPMILCGPAFLFACSSDDPGTGGAPHLLIISLDTTRADHLASHGHPWVETPTLDAIGNESLIFDSCTSPINTTLASHSSLFTGKYPKAHGVPRNGFLLSDQNDTIAEILSRVGYHTAGFVASFALNRRYNLNQGFDHWDDTYQGRKAGLENQRSAERVTDSVLAYLDATWSEEPIFLFVHYYDPHRPYDPPAPHDAQYDRIELPGRGPRTTCKETDPDGNRVRPDPRCYAGEISYMDAQIARLLEGLEARGVLDDSILLVTSDHGELLDEKSPNYSHGVTVFQSEVRAVCMLLDHRNPSRGRVGAVVSLVDFFPTLLEAMGLPHRDPIDGEPIPLDGETVQSRIRYGESSQPNRPKSAEDGWFNRNNPQYVREGSYKYIRIPTSNRERLFDLERDPGETHDLLVAPTPSEFERAGRMRALLADWQSTGPTLPTRYIKGEMNDTEQRLRALGYIE